MASVLDRMIDAACGVPPGFARLAPAKIILRCPRCAAEKAVRMDRTDPPATAVVIYPCPDCPPHDGVECRYLDAAGNEVLPT